MQDSPVLDSQPPVSILDAPSPDVDPSISHVIINELDAKAQLKLEVIQYLTEPSDRATYGQKLRDAAEKLGISMRSVQRLVKRWEQEGLAGIAKNSRADKGKHRIGNFWEDFIINSSDTF